MANAHNAGIVSVNRRDYPGAKPYTDKERGQLQSVRDEIQTAPDAARAKLIDFMKERAREVHELLVRFVTENKVPRAQEETNTSYPTRSSLTCAE